MLITFLFPTSPAPSDPALRPPRATERCGEVRSTATAAGARGIPRDVSTGVPIQERGQGVSHSLSPFFPLPGFLSMAAR